MLLATIDRRDGEYSDYSRVKRTTTYEVLLFCGCVASFACMLFRAFFGTELTDEAYYVSNAITILHGNLPYAYNNDAMTFGTYFLLIPQLFIYELLIPSFKGVFLFTRISFVIFKFVVLLLAYIFLTKRFQRKNVLLSLCVMIPYSAVIANYSYNSVPAFLFFLIAILLYDAVEFASKKSGRLIAISGFLSSLGFFSHYAYAIVILFFLAVILIRSQRDKKIQNLVAYGIGGLLEVFVIMFPIGLQSGMGVLMEGIIGQIFPFPSQPMSDTTWIDRLKIVYYAGKEYFVLHLVITVVITFFVHRYVSEKKERYTWKESVFVALTVSYIASVLTVIENLDVSIWQREIGICTAIFVSFFILLRCVSSNTLIIYAGIYPVVFAISMVILTGSNSAQSRFIALIPAIPCVMLAMLENRRELVRLCACIATILCVLAIGYSQCKYVYRDANITSLVYRVEDGVYSGIYTTEQRARDLPEMEAFLNLAIKDDELYAFRDNVPFAYLMNKSGKMCEMNTWDCLQYTYGINAPSKLFAYYKRTDSIPDKIIYIDFGRDDMLSIQDSEFRYNDFVNSYYTLTEDFCLNETFYHVMVYEKNSEFDGDYDYWINSYYGLYE